MTPTSTTQSKRQQSYYDILGVPPTATTEDIKIAARRRMAAIEDAVTRGRRPETDIKRGRTILRKVFKVLTDEQSRRRHDLHLMYDMDEGLDADSSRSAQAVWERPSPLHERPERAAPTPAPEPTGEVDQVLDSAVNHRVEPSSLRESRDVDSETRVWRAEPEGDTQFDLDDSSGLTPRGAVDTGDSVEVADPVRDEHFAADLTGPLAIDVGPDGRAEQVAEVEPPPATTQREWPSAALAAEPDTSSPHLAAPVEVPEREEAKAVADQTAIQMPTPQAGMKACPNCAANIRAAAILCRYCKARIDTPTVAPHGRHVAPTATSAPPKAQIRSSVGASCAYCLSASDVTEFGVCPTCGAAHHLDCWNENAGCAVMGCTAGPAQVASVRY